MSVLADVVAIAAEAVRGVAGEPVTYKRGALELSLTSAVRGSTDWDNNAVNPGVRVSDRSTDWMIAAADLVNGSTQLEPQRGDEIIANGVTFRVMPFSNDAPLWRWHDRDARTTYRIHTKERD